jgi:hypothetical protein
LGWEFNDKPVPLICVPNIFRGGAESQVQTLPVVAQVQNFLPTLRKKSNRSPQH